MIEIALYIALGFFLASILALAALPFIWGRAVRLTRKAIETYNPISYARATMAKDALRAKHAIAVRQMEVRLQSMTEKLAENASARSLAEAKVAELQEELSIVQLKSARDRKSMAQKATRFLRRRSPSDPIPFSAKDRITTDPIVEPEETASLVQEPAQIVAEQQQSAEVIKLQQKAAVEKTRELDQELKEAPAKPIALVDTSGLEDMDNPLADLAAQISKQVSEMTAEADTKRKPTSPAEAAKLASQSFSKLKNRYGSLERERDKLKHDLKVEKAAQVQPAKRSLSNPNIKTPEQMKSLENNLDDAKKTIEQLTKQLEERARNSSNIGDAVDLRNELKDLAAQITAKAISENPPLSDKYDEVLNDLSTLTGANDAAEASKPKTRRTRASAKATKPRTRKTATAKNAEAASKADDTAAQPEADKNLAERIADLRKTSNSHG